MSEYINNIIYGIKSFLSGMQLTFRHFKNKKDLVATLQYPNEKWPQPDRNIGFDHSEYNVIRSRLHVDIDDCIGCLQCERACPVDCIKIDTIKPPKDSDYDCGKTAYNTQKKMIVPRFTIDMSECMYCNLCVYPCPEDCIYMVGGPNQDKHEMDYEFSEYERHGLIYEFATTTEQDIIDIGGETYLKERKGKENKRKQGELLEGLVKSDDPMNEDSTDVDAPKKEHKDPLLEIFNIVPDKVARGIAKKAVVFGKRNSMDFPSMSEEVSKRIVAAGKVSNKMSDAINLLKSYTVPVENKSESTTSEDSSSNIDKEIISKNASTPSFDIKSLDFIQDKMSRGIAKKAFMAAKRGSLSGNQMIEDIIKSLEDNDKFSVEIKEYLSKFMISESSSDINSNAVNDSRDVNQTILFDIKLLNGIEDKMIRGSCKKIYMAGKRAKHSTNQVIEEIFKTLEDKLDDSTIKLLKEIK